jgi:hypothetical protein
VDPSTGLPLATYDETSPDAVDAIINAPAGPVRV